jgi:putative PIG3 family NAD(P)H quinone oxidoreductase
MNMKAILVVKDGSRKRLLWGDSPLPTIGPEDVLIKIRATAVNRADLLQVQGLYPPPPGASEILGLELSGEIAELGSEVHEYSLGERVMALLPGGGYAQYAALPASLLLRIPESWSFEQAASVPEVFFTAYLNLFQEGRLQADESVLIHSGASGVGTAAIQLASYFGAKVYATAGSLEKCRVCLSLGAELAINYKEQDFAEEILKHNKSGVNLIIDTVGASFLNRNLKVLAPRGRLVLLGLLGGAKTELNLGSVLMKRLQIIGSTLRNRTLAEKAALTKEFSDKVLPLFSQGKIKTVVDRVYPIEETEQAHKYVADNLNMGKVILVLPHES